MKKYVLFLLTAVLLAACQKANTVLEPLETPLVPPGSSGTMTAYLPSVPGCKTSWEVEDQVIGWIKGGRTFTFTVTGVDAATGKAVLDLEDEIEFEAGQRLYAIYCPGKAEGDISTDKGGIDVDFTNQEDGGIFELMTAEATVADNGTFSFKFRRVAAIIELENPIVTGGTNTSLESVIVSGHSLVSKGSVRVDAESDTLSFVGALPEDFIYRKPLGITLSATGSSAPIFIAVPPCKVDKISIINSKGALNSYVLASDESVEKNYFLKLTSKTFPTVSLPAAYFPYKGISWGRYNIDGTGTTPSKNTGTLSRWGDGEKLIWTKNSSNRLVFDDAHQSGFIDYDGELYYDAASASYTKYNATDGKIVLDPVDDIVQLRFPGTGWRMATAEEFRNLNDALKDETVTVTYKSESSGRGIQVSYNGKNVMFTNYFNCGSSSSTDGTTTIYQEPYGYYWTSSIDPTDPRKAINFYFDKGPALGGTGAIVEGSDFRRFGAAIRPVKNVE